MSRRIALALSFSMTIVVAFAVATLASQAGWLQAKPDEPVAAVEASAPLEGALDPTTIQPVVITDYVYQDIPVIVPSSQQAVAPTPAPTAVPQPTSPPAPQVQVIAPAPNDQSRQVDPRPVLQQVSSPHDDGDGDEDDEEHEYEEEHERSQGHEEDDD